MYDMIKRTVLGGVLCASLVGGAGITSTDAAPSFHDLTLPFFWGPLAGQTYSGNFSIEGDDLTGVGVEKFVPPGLASVPGSAGQIYSFDVTVAGTKFALEHIVIDPVKPSHIKFTDGALSEISLLLRNPLGGARLEFLPSDEYVYEFTYTPGIGGIGGSGAPIGEEGGSVVPGIVPGFVSGSVLTISSFSSVTFTMMRPPTIPNPEPSSVVLAATGLIMLGGFAYRRRKAAAA